MNKLALFAFVFAAIGCKHSEFDVTPAQVSQKSGPSFYGSKKGLPPGFGFGSGHLPPGSVKHDLGFKKGDRLPDGSIATGKEHFFRVEFPDPPASANGKNVTTGEKPTVGK
jgi:hypothetical protein